MPEAAKDTSDLGARLAEPGPKRLLSLDGGGIRGLISLAYLSRVESILRRRFGDPDLVLSDYFDLIAGTSTGSLIAAGLALGWPVSRLEEVYRDLGPRAFQLRKTWLGKLGRRLWERFDERPLTHLLADCYGDLRLDAPEFRVGLLVVAKRVDTASVWILANLPDQRFYEANRHLPLWAVLRASAAAPTYFTPQWIDDVDPGAPAVFVDGGVSMHGSPALQCLMAATLDGFGLRWPLGEREILLCSVGTGYRTAVPDRSSLPRYTNLGWAKLVIEQLIQDARELNETMLQWMSESPTARVLDLRLGTLEGQLLGRAPLLSYRRWDVALRDEELTSLGFTYDPERRAKLVEMGAVDRIDDLIDIGKAAAEAQVSEDQLPPEFDRPVRR